MRRLVLLVATAIVVLVGAAAPVSAQDNAETDVDSDARGLVLLSETEHDWLIRKDAWLNLLWTTDTEVTNFRVTAKSNDRNVRVDYPENTPGFSGPLNGGTLSPNEIDHTAIFIWTTWRAASVYTIDLTLTYEMNGESITEEIGLTFNETMWDGDTFVLTSDDLTIDLADPERSAGWVELDYIGIAPQLWDVRITVDTSVNVIYPRGSYTSMHNEKSLRVDERDVARFYIEPSQLEAGDVLGVEVTTAYKTGDKDNTDRETHEITVVVVDSRLGA